MGNYASLKNIIGHIMACGNNNLNEDALFHRNGKGGWYRGCCFSALLRPRANLYAADLIKRK